MNEQEAPPAENESRMEAFLGGSMWRKAGRAYGKIKHRMRAKSCAAEPCETDGVSAAAPAAEPPVKAAESPGEAAKSPGKEDVSPARRLEESHRSLLERIQTLVGIALRLKECPEKEELRARLTNGVLDLIPQLEAEGFQVVRDDTVRSAFVSVVDGVERPRPLVVKPAILRDGLLVLKGMLCLSSGEGAPADQPTAPGQAEPENRQ